MKEIRNHLQVSHGFERAAAGYDNYAVLQRAVGEEILDRLQVVRLEPAFVLDAGCGTGHCTRGLRARYKGARIIGLDRAAGMLTCASGKRRWLDRSRFIQADASSIPMANHSVDLVVSNLMLQWCEPEAVFREFRRILKPEGLLMFSTFGPDTLLELRESWQSADSMPHVIDFYDMHDLGDMLMQAGFLEPVMDVDRHTLTYSNVMELLRDLHGIGSRNISSQRRRGLMGKGVLQGLEQAYSQFTLSDGRLPASYEVVYGHAWSGGQGRPDSPDQATVDFDPYGRQ